MRRYRISGRRRFNGQNFGLVSITNKNNAEEMAKRARRASRGAINARVVPLKSANGYGLYVNANSRRRRYNYVRVPFRRFSDSLIGIDVVEMDKWLRTQPGYNPALNWKDNLRNIGGPDAMRTLETLVDPATAVQESMLQATREKELARQLDNLLVEEIESGFRPDVLLGMQSDEEAERRRMLGEPSIEDLLASSDPEMGLSTEVRSMVEGAIMRTDEQLDDAFGMGIDFDVLVQEDGSIKDVSEVDIFDLLGLDDGEPQEMDDNLGEILGEWFEQELANYGMIADETRKITEGTETALSMLANQSVATKNEIGTIASRELDAMVEDVFADALFGEDTQMGDEIEWGGRKVRRPPTALDLNPALGRSQRIMDDPNAPPGYWQFQPLGAAGALGEGVRTQTRDAFMVVDSLGAIIGAWHYTKEPGEEESIEEFEALNQAIYVAKQTSGFDPYSKGTFEQYGKLAPGVAIIDAELTIDNQGQWLGWDIKLTEEDLRLDIGNFLLFQDNQQLKKGTVPAEELSRWILPQRVQQVGMNDPNRQRFEFLLGEDGAADAFAQAEDHAKLARAEIAKSRGGDAQEVLDALLNNQFVIRSNITGDQITTYMPSWRDAIRELELLRRNSDRTDIDDVSVFVAPSNPDGSTDVSKGALYATASLNLDGEYALTFKELSR